MEWYVYWGGDNEGIVKRNVFQLSVRFNESIQHLKTALRSNYPRMDYFEFSEELRHAAAYTFWSRCEHEILVSPWPQNDRQLKISVYDQLMMNWDPFCKYTLSCLTREIENEEKERESKSVGRDSQ